MNDTTKWIMIVLLLLLIAAAVIVLLRSPGKDRDGGTGAVDRAEDDRRTVDDGRQERLGAAPERGVYDQEADPRTTEAAPVVRDEQPVQDEPALLPRTDREAKLLAPVAAKASDAAKAAFVAARTAGQDKLDELGINRDAARAKVDQLVDSASQAASSASAAARDSVRSRNEV